MSTLTVPTIFARITEQTGIVPRIAADESGEFGVVTWWASDLPDATQIAVISEYDDSPTVRTFIDVAASDFTTSDAVPLIAALTTAQAVLDLVQSAGGAVS